MFIEKMLNQGSVPLLEQMLRFTSARSNLLADNIANVSTPGYKQKDLDIRHFQQMLDHRLQQRDSGAGGEVGFGDIGLEAEEPHRGILFHDQSNRSMEQLMTDEAKNTLMNNAAIEILRQQFSTLQLALRERVS